ncbi:MAG TPA: hypothetical protein VKV40_17010 [Ktedonobacteraceae bacterium]|jgi:WD40 repeat protein|nr:hypothetical protein [Ktedonobacteraceae bacterium]
MPEHRSTPAYRLLALARYISALEQGDIEALAAVLSEASHDPILSALLEEQDSVYQALDGTAFSAQEAQQALSRVFLPGQNGFLTGGPENAPIRHTLPFAPMQNETSLPGVIPHKRKRLRTRIEEQVTQAAPRLGNWRQVPAHPSQARRALQLFAAFLVVCALVVGMALTLREMHPDSGASPSTSQVSGPHPNHGTASPTGQAWGQTLYTRPVDSGFSNVASIAWSPNSQRVAALAYDGVQIWDATTGANWIISKAPTNFGILQNITWSPNGEWIAVAAETGVVIINAQTGALVHEYSINSLAISPSLSLAASRGSTLDAPLPASGGGSYVSSVVWSPDSRQLAVTDYLSTTSQDNFIIINAQAGAPVHSFQVPAGDGVVVGSWSPDGKYLAASVTSLNPNTAANKAQVWVWSTSTYQPVMKRATNGGGGNPMPAHQFAWQPHSDNLLFAEGNLSNLRYGWEASTIVLWSVPRNKLLKQFSFENTGIFSWSPNGHDFATGSYANQPATDQSTADQVAIIDAQSGRQIYAYNQNDNQVLDLAWSPNGRYIASGGLSSVKTWIAP